MYTTLIHALVLPSLGFPDIRVSILLQPIVFAFVAVSDLDYYGLQDVEHRKVYKLYTLHNAIYLIK